MINRKRFYILLVSREEDGTLRKIPIPSYYAYVVAAVALIGLFTVTGLAGSYTRMLIKTSRFNQLRHDHQALQQDYAHLEKQAHEKDVQAASLGSLASEVSALYGLTAGKIKLGKPSFGSHKEAADLKITAYTPDSYYKSLYAFYALRNSALDGEVTRLSEASSSIGRVRNPLLPGHDLPGFDEPSFGGDETAYTPTIWPIVGPISSSFGQREDPILGNGEGEFHPGIDITSPMGTPIHATADGVVSMAGMENGYGRMVRIDHGHGVETCYGHMSGFAVIAGQSVARGQVIGYVGHSGRTTGNHVHYEVRIRNTPVNPHKYLHDTVAGLPAAATGPAL